MNFKWDNFFGGGLLLLVMGGFLLWRGVVVIRLGFDQHNWVATTAVITQSETRRSTGDRPRTSFDFQYQYTVDGETYQSRRYSAAQLAPSESEGVDRFVVGEETGIFYNPDNPKQAVIEVKRPSLFVYLGILLGFVFIGMGVGLTFMGDITGLGHWYMEKQEIEYADFGATFAQRQDEPVEPLAQEIIAKMPRPLQKTIRLYIKNNNQFIGVRYLADRTGLNQAICRAIFEQMEKKD